MHTYDYTLHGTVAPKLVEAALAPFLQYCRTSYAKALQRRQLCVTET
ncbi:hypothetical protein [Rugamonas aquatica]|nr:hypothetical protein [Rugamonas aquatica]